MQVRDWILTVLHQEDKKGKNVMWCYVCSRQDTLAGEPRCGGNSALLLLPVIPFWEICVSYTSNSVFLDVCIAKAEISPTKEIQHNFLELYAEASVGELEILLRQEDQETKGIVIFTGIRNKDHTKEKGVLLQWEQRRICLVHR